MVYVNCWGEFVDVLFLWLWIVDFNFIFDGREGLYVYLFCERDGGVLCIKWVVWNFKLWLCM